MVTTILAWIGGLFLGIVGIDHLYNKIKERQKTPADIKAEEVQKWIYDKYNLGDDGVRFIKNAFDGCEYRFRIRFPECHLYLDHNSETLLNTTQEEVFNYIDTNVEQHNKNQLEAYQVGQILSSREKLREFILDTIYRNEE